MAMPSKSKVKELHTFALNVQFACFWGSEWAEVSKLDLPLPLLIRPENDPTFSVGAFVEL